MITYIVIPAHPTDVVAQLRTLTIRKFIERALKDLAEAATRGVCRVLIGGGSTPYIPEALDILESIKGLRCVRDGFAIWLTYEDAVASSEEHQEFINVVWKE